MKENESKELLLRDTSYSYVICRPGGNDTCLVFNNPNSSDERKRLNDIIMEIFPTVEQVGFINPDKTTPGLIMAGGEFCGNATRSTAYQYLGGKPGNIEMSVSGVFGNLQAGITTSGEAFAQMPIYSDPINISEDSSIPGNYVVKMEGITHYIDTTTNTSALSQEDIKTLGMRIIIEKGLDEYPAAGVMFTQNTPEAIIIKPVVYVRDIDTLFYETACGSGTTAVGLLEAVKKGKSIKRLPIIQPTGSTIYFSVDFDNTEFGYAEISGPIDTLSQGYIESVQGYAIEIISTPQQLQELLTDNKLFDLYQEAFGDPPYEEQFTPNDVLKIFEEYLNQGIILVAKNVDGIVGFIAATPSIYFGDTTELLNQSVNFIPETTWYIADLGIAKNKRRTGIARRLIEQVCTIVSQTSEKIILRTSEENNKAIALYQSLGFNIISNITQEVESTRIGGQLQKDIRIFLIKEL